MKIRLGLFGDWVDTSEATAEYTRGLSTLYRIHGAWILHASLHGGRQLSSTEASAWLNDHGMGDATPSRGAVSENAHSLLDWIGQHVARTGTWPTVDRAVTSRHTKRGTVAKLARELREAGYGDEIPPRWGTKGNQNGH